MRYIGNKLNLLEFIYSVVQKHAPLKGVFCDIFSGTANVGKYFKNKGFRIISNDIMTYSYSFQKTYIENNYVPKFNRLINVISKPDIFKVFNYLNNCNGKKGFIFSNYTSEGTAHHKYRRNYFSSENACKIDQIRETIEEWRVRQLINENEFHILLCSLLEEIPSVSNIAGTYGAFLKINDARMFKPITLQVPSLIESNLSHECYQMDSNCLIRKIISDILYIDPPYNNRQYAPNYHILESVAVWDKQIIDNKTGLRPYDNQKSKYCYDRECVAVFEDLVDNARCKHILFSYNTEGIIPHKEIMRILSNRGKVILYTQDYRRFKSHSKGKGLGRALQELLFYVKVN